MMTFFGNAIDSIIGQAPMQTLAAFRAPTWIPQFFLDTNYLYWVVLGLIGLAVLFVGLRNKQSTLTRVGLGAIVFLLLWIAATFVFISPKQRLYDAHAAILTAAKNNDPKGITQWLADDFRFGPNDRKLMSSVIESTLSVIKVKSNMVRFYDAKFPASDMATSQLNVITSIEAPMMPSGNVLTKWHLEWIDVPGQDWRLRTITHSYHSDGTNDTEIPPDLGVK